MLTACVALNNVPVNVYDVGISVGGNNYIGSGGSALEVFDPSLGLFKGIGTVVHNGGMGTILSARFSSTAVKSGRGGRFGLQVFSPSGAVIPDMTFDPITLRGGNIKR